MPKDKDFKHLVRERMSETGKRYTEAREEILARPALAPIPKPWFMGGDRPSAYEFGLLPDSITQDGRRVVRLRLVEGVDLPRGFGTLMQNVRATHYLGQRVRFGAMARAVDVTGWAGLWMRVDGPNGTAAFDNMQGRPLRGTTDWARADIVLDVTQDARSIHFGMILAGDGAVDLSQLRFEVVDATFPVTSEESMADEPQALDFGVAPAS